jgi:hypothetical protein
MGIGLVAPVASSIGDPDDFEAHFGSPKGVGGSKKLKQSPERVAV